MVSEREVPLRDRWQELRALLLDPERRRLRAVEQRLEDPHLNVDQVSQVLPEAIQRRATSDRDLGVALGPVVSDALRTSIRKDPQPLVDAIFPIIGPAIRRAIAATFAEMVQSVNTALDHSLTLHGLGWRIEAWRTGKSFAEVALAHSLVFRVEQLFVMHRNSGLLIEHRTAPGVDALAPDMVGGMLTAIADFVRDSFQVSRHQGLNSMALGDLTVWVEQGPAATMAAVIRGNAPASYRQTLLHALEELHRVHGSELAQSAATGAGFTIRPDLLEPCLVAQLQKPARGTGLRFGLVAAAALLALGWFLVPRVLQGRRFDRFVEALRQEPGIVVGSSGRQGGRFVLSGLRDPLSRDPSTLLAANRLDTTRVSAHWEPYIALRPEFIVRRSQQALRPPATVQLQMRGDTLAASGIASAAWRSRAAQLAPAIAGVAVLDTAALKDSTVVALQGRADSLSALVLAFPFGDDTVAAASRATFDSLSTRLQALLGEASRYGLGVHVEVRGSTDSVGSADVNAPLRLARARNVRLRLIGRGLDPALLLTSPDPSTVARRAQVVVTLTPAPATPRLSR